MISSLGLITLQTAFLQNSDTITTEQYHLSAIKISEAIIKQFLGGITSPKVWKHSWLWEGLIKYLGRLVLTPLNPQWPMEEMHLMHITTRAMDIDAIQGWESILAGTSEDGKNDEFYIDKSAAVMAMLHSSMGEDNFRGCLGAFLNAYKFQTAEPIDLWNICTKKVNNTKNIREMMNLWTTLESFPLLTVTKVGSTITISQKEFHPMDFHAIQDDPYLLNFTTTSTSSTSTTPAPNSNKKKSTTKWVFPVKYVTNVVNISDTLWFHNSDGNNSIRFHLNRVYSIYVSMISVTFTIPIGVKWIKVNSGQNGYYRVLYDEDNWGYIVEELKMNHETFSPAVSNLLSTSHNRYLIRPLHPFNCVGSHWPSIGRIHTVSRQFDALPDNHESSFLFAEGTKLGSNDHRTASPGEMASHFEIFRMLSDVDRSGEANPVETRQLDGLE